MPLCPQITNTPVTVTQTADFTVSSVLPVVPATTTQLDEVIVLADGKTKAYYQTTAPTTGMTEGDIWFDTDDGNKQYYYTGTAWVSVQDTAIAAAQAAATAAQTTADGKNKIYRQGTTPVGTFTVGDLWFNTSNDNSISRWDGSSWVANTLGNNALASISANKITAGTIDASIITVSNINAGNISTGTLNADRIASASITGTKIAAGTILASNIATGTITATQIAAGTITSSQIATGTITADRITTGAIGGFTITGTYLGGSGGFTLYSNGVIDGGLSNTIFYGYANIGGGPATGERFIVTGNSSFVGQAIFSGNTTSQTHFFSPFATNVTSAANGYWVTSGSGRMTYTTASSQRYKHDIVDLVSISEYDPKKLLNLPVRAFRYNEDYVTPTDDRAEVLIPGFIAEEVDAIYPIACDYSETKGPESWNDRVILPAMLALIQDLYQEIEKLKGE
jgi:hypothetical protein